MQITRRSSLRSSVLRAAQLGQSEMRRFPQTGRAPGSHDAALNSCTATELCRACQHIVQIHCSCPLPADKMQIFCSTVAISDRAIWKSGNETEIPRVSSSLAARSLRLAVRKSAASHYGEKTLLRRVTGRQTGDETGETA